MTKAKAKARPTADKTKTREGHNILTLADLMMFLYANRFLVTELKCFSQI